MKKVSSLLWIIAVFLMTLVPSTAVAGHTIGLIGITSAVQGSKEMNFNDYIDMSQNRDPIETAQDIFTEYFNSNPDFLKTELEPIDMTERASQAIRDELYLQLKVGDPSAAVKYFPVTPEYLIYGGISNFTISHRESLGGNNKSVEADLTIYIMDVASKRTVFVATGKGKSSAHNENSITDEDWHAALTKALDQIMTKLIKSV